MNPVYIHRIETSLPEFLYRQDAVCEEMKRSVATTELEKRILHRIYSQSGIETRRSVLGGFPGKGAGRDPFEGQGTDAGTGLRNRIYEEKARELFVETAEKLTHDLKDRTLEITHLITISCTGFYAPGPDFDIIRHLKLDPSLERYHLGFMGCYAAISGLKFAEAICRADPAATVLVVAVELCTLHFQGGTETDDLISTSLFADGSAGALVSAREPEKPGALRLDSFESKLLDKGSDEMAWKLGDTGFKMVLSTYVPELLAVSLDTLLDPLCELHGVNRREIDWWAIHPGGRLILDRLQNQLELSEEDLSCSRKVLSEHGNMSSPTILHVLSEIMRMPRKTGRKNRVLAMAFGPGLTIESALMERSL